MLFNSFEFAIYLPLVFIMYWFVFQKNLRLQNLFVVAVSYLFYGWWDWRFLILIAFTSICSYFSGVLMERSDHRKLIATTNVVINLVILCIFKYFNFFSDNFARLFSTFGYELDWVTLDLLLPVGISFYTFQAIGYSIDVYKRKMEPTHDVVSFLAFVSFFPQLVAGPIERATRLLPQFYVSRHFDYIKAVDGMRQILWGLFKKIVVADNCAHTVNMIFNNYSEYSGSTLFYGGILFAFQIYGDFSGYSDIAIGSARLFGIDLTRNFNFPYFSRDIAEFWRRWHISLNTWFRDYIYIPLGGSREGVKIAVRNTFIIFLVSGFWHGANWTFIVWGLLHALLFLPLLITNRNKRFSDTVAANRNYPTLTELFQMGTTFLLVVLGWIIFRADTITIAADYIINIFNTSLFTLPELGGKCLYYIALLLVVEWIGRKEQFGLARLPKIWVLRYAIYFIILILILEMGGDASSFIYFQF